MVLGAGFTGLAAARQLALHHPDDEIILVEAQEVGFGASGRNSGFAIDLPHDIGAPDDIGDLATTRMKPKLNLRAQSILRGLINPHGIDCQIRPDGKYQAAVEDKGLAVLEAYRSSLDKLGQAYEMIDTRDLPEHFGTGFYRKALYTPGTQLAAHPGPAPAGTQQLQLQCQWPRPTALPGPCRAPNVHAALCCNGLGITRGTATDTLLADWLSGERDELIGFLLRSDGPNRNPPEPLLSVGVNLNLHWGQRRAGLES